MKKEEECICCHEIAEMQHKLHTLTETEPDTFTKDNVPTCITEHRGFDQNCTAIYALETAYVAYRNQYGNNIKKIKDVEE